MNYQSISIMKAKKGDAIIWVVTLLGDTNDPTKMEQKEFSDFTSVKQFINELWL